MASIRMVSTFLKTLIAVVLLTTATGCTDSLQDLVGFSRTTPKSATSNLTTTPTAPFNLAVSSYSLSMTSTPTATWNDCSIATPLYISGYKARVRKASDDSVVQDWTTLVSGQTLTALSLALNTDYILDIRCVGSNNVLSSIASSGYWRVAAALSLSPTSTASLLTGETYQFTAGGGIPAYTYAAANTTGYINASTGLYSVPLTAIPVTDSVTVGDSQSQTSSAITVNVRSFQTKLTQHSSVTGTPTTSSLLNVVKMGTALYAASDVTLYVSNSTSRGKPRSIQKSTDGGATWTHISSLLPLPGAALNSSFLLANGTTLYAVGVAYFLTPVGNNYHTTYVAESTDSGVTWTTRVLYNEPDRLTAEVSGAIFTNDNHLMYVGRMSAPSDVIAFTRKCNPTTWVCTNVDTFTGDGSQTNMTNIARDSGNGIITTLRKATTGTNGIQVRRSTNNGTSWSDLEFNNGASMSATSLAVSSDGQYILYGGANGASTPYIRQSLDGGATWTSNSSICPGWRPVGLKITASDDAIQLCFNLSGGVTTTYAMTKAIGATTWTQRMSLASATPISLTAIGTDYAILMTGTPMMRTSSDDGLNWSDANGTPGAMTAVNGDVQLNGIATGNNSAEIWAAGNKGIGASSRRAMIVRSTDSGDNWSEVFVDGSGSSSFNSISIIPSSGVVIAGGVKDTNHWYTYKYDPSGAGIWSLSEDYQPASTTSVNLVKLFANTTSTMYAAGSYRPTSDNKDRWLVRMTSNGGGNWTDRDDFQLASGFHSEATAGAVLGTDLYVVGYGIDASSVSHWLVRKWDGTSWSIDDDETRASVTGTNAKPRAIFAASDGSLYVAGEYKSSTGLIRWMVKRKVAGGSWQILDDYVENTGVNIGVAIPYAIAEDSAGRIFVSGQVFTASTETPAARARIRMYNGTTWTTVDSAILNGNNSYTDIRRCLNTRICAVGTGTNSDFQFRGFVRILSP